MFKPIPGRRYLMPIQFGPNDFLDVPDGVEWDTTQFPKRRTAFVHYLTRAEQLREILPPGFELYGEPIISFEMTHHFEFPPFGGRGYGIFGINYPAMWKGEEKVIGMFRSVTFEDLPDAIIGGREELGCHKLHCDFYEPRVLGNNYYYHAGYYGRTFFEMDLTDLVEQPIEKDPVDMPFVGPAEIAGERNRGLLYYKYIPRLGEVGVADVEHGVLMGTETGRLLTVDKHFTGGGRAQFFPVRWHDVPTYHHVINAFAKLDLLEFRGASLTFTRGQIALKEFRPLK